MKPISIVGRQKTLRTQRPRAQSAATPNSLPGLNYVRVCVSVRIDGSSSESIKADRARANSRPSCYVIHSVFHHYYREQSANQPADYSFNSPINRSTTPTVTARMCSDVQNVWHDVGVVERHSIPSTVISTSPMDGWLVAPRPLYAHTHTQHRHHAHTRRRPIYRRKSKRRAADGPHIYTDTLEKIAATLNCVESRAFAGGAENLVGQRKNHTCLNISRYLRWIVNQQQTVVAKSADSPITLITMVDRLKLHWHPHIQPKAA